MTEEYIFCAVNDRDEVQWVCGSSQKTRYFKTDKYLNSGDGTKAAENTYSGMTTA